MRKYLPYISILMFCLFLLYIIPKFAPSNETIYNTIEYYKTFGTYYNFQSAKAMLIRRNIVELVLGTIAFVYMFIACLKIKNNKHFVLPCILLVVFGNIYGIILVLTTIVILKVDKND